VVEVAFSGDENCSLFQLWRPGLDSWAIKAVYKCFTGYIYCGCPYSSFQLINEFNFPMVLVSPQTRRGQARPCLCIYSLNCQCPQWACEFATTKRSDELSLYMLSAQNLLPMSAFVLTPHMVGLDGLHHDPTAQGYDGARTDTVTLTSHNRERNR
jgi:hypothetical protein